MLKVEGYKMEFFSLLSTWDGYVWLVCCENVERIYIGFAYTQGMGIYIYIYIYIYMSILKECLQGNGNTWIF
jgi:hypothetical protein